MNEIDITDITAATAAEALDAAAEDTEGETDESSFFKPSEEELEMDAEMADIIDRLDRDARSLLFR